MSREVEYTDEFGSWWAGLAESQQDDVAAVVELLSEHGPGLPFPYSSGVEGSRHSRLRELRIQSGGRPIRVSTPSTQDGQQSCSSAVTRQAMTDSTSSMCLLRTSSTTSTWKSCDKKD